MNRVDADVRGDFGERQRFSEPPLDERPRLLEPRRHRPDTVCSAARHPPRRFGENAERDALDGEPRDLVTQPELTVEAMREMEDEPAAKRGDRKSTRLNSSHLG